MAFGLFLSLGKKYLFIEVCCNLTEEALLINFVEMVEILYTSKVLSIKISIIFDVKSVKIIGLVYLLVYSLLSKHLVLLNSIIMEN